MDNRIVLLAKAYAGRLRAHETADKAREYIETRFGPFSEADIETAIHLSQVGAEVGARLQELRDVPSVTLSDACLGGEPCIGRASVRVTVSMTLAGGQKKYRTIHRVLDWSATIGDVSALVADYVREAGDEGYDVKGSDWVFDGPTLDV